MTQNCVRWFGMLMVLLLNAACSGSDESAELDSSGVSEVASVISLERGAVPFDAPISDELADNSSHMWRFDLVTEADLQLDFDAQWLAELDLPGQPGEVISVGSHSQLLSLAPGEYVIGVRGRYGGGPYTLILNNLNAATATPMLTLTPTPTTTPTLTSTSTPQPTRLPTSTSTPIPTAVDEVRLGTGDVQITLRWRTLADLDLHVMEPSGEQVNFVSPISQTNGQLDVDANHPCDVRTLTPVENIFWPVGQSPDGDYEVFVHYHPLCGDEGATDYEVTITIGDDPPRRFTGTLSGPGEESDIITFMTGAS